MRITSGWRLQDTQHRLDSMFPKRVGFYRSSETFGQWSSQWASLVNWICTDETWRTRLGGTDQKPPFEIWSVNLERDSIECWRKRIIRWINWKQYIKENTKMHGTFWYQNNFKTKTSISRRKELRKCWKDANHCFSTFKFFKWQDGCSTRPWIPLSTSRWRRNACDGSG